MASTNTKASWFTLQELQRLVLESTDNQVIITQFRGFRRRGGAVTAALLDRYDYALENQDKIRNAQNQNPNRNQNQSQNNTEPPNMSNNTNVIFAAQGEGQAGNNANVNFNTTPPVAVEAAPPQRSSLWGMGPLAHESVKLGIAAVQSCWEHATPIDKAKANVVEGAADFVKTGAYILGAKWLPKFW